MTIFALLKQCHSLIFSIIDYVLLNLKQFLKETYTLGSIDKQHIFLVPKYKALYLNPFIYVSIIPL